jgi:hypothetical protein
MSNDVKPPPQWNYKSEFGRRCHLITCSDCQKNASFLRLRFHFGEIFLSLFLGNFGECPGGELTHELGW